MNHHQQTASHLGIANVKSTHTSTIPRDYHGYISTNNLDKSQNGGLLGSSNHCSPSDSKFQCTLHNLNTFSNNGFSLLSGLSPAQVEKSSERMPAKYQHSEESSSRTTPAQCATTSSPQTPATGPRQDEKKAWQCKICPKSFHRPSLLK